MQASKKGESIFKGGDASRRGRGGVAGAWCGGGALQAECRIDAPAARRARLRSGFSRHGLANRERANMSRLGRECEGATLK